MKKIVSILAVFLLLANVTFAQSFFSPIPKPAQPAVIIHPRLSIGQVDSAILKNDTPVTGQATYVGFRPTTTAVYGYNGSTSVLLIGIGASYEHDTYQQSTGKYYTDWSIAALAYGGGSTSQHPGDVIAAGLNVSFLNKLLSAGVAYDFVGHRVFPTLGVSVSLNN
jgi:hypothetical protein